MDEALDIDDDFQRDDDQDSSMGDDQYTITTSIASSVQDFRHEHGRRYHAFDDNQYALPNDEIEAARLDLQHYTWKTMFEGGFGLVPITDNIKQVLDVGTGTGIWAIELAQMYPNLSVIATDLSPIQPEFIPPNCQFIIDNAEHEWVFDHKFDYVHARMLTIGVHDWAQFFKHCWNSIEPGGWLETSDTQFPPGRVEDEDEVGKSAFLKWGQLVYEGAQKAGIDARASDKFKELLEAQGFIDIERVDVQWPIGPWAKGKKNKIMGKLLLENTQKVVPAIATGLFTRQLGWTKEEVDLFTEEVLKEVNDTKKNHFYYKMCLYKCRKPK